jgi:hypothetical protein
MAFKALPGLKPITRINTIMTQPGRGFPGCSFRLLLLVCLLFTPALPAADHDWPVYLGDKASTHYSTLKQITRENVAFMQK